jgi:transposase InsO family protein
VSRYIDEHRGRFGVEPICRTLDVSASAYYQRATGQRSARAVEDERLLQRIGEVHAANYYAYGYRRTWKALLRAGENVGRDRVKRLMRREGIQGAKRRGKPWRTTTPDPAATRSPDLVNRDFTADRPDQLWVADFTYLRCWEGMVFLSFIIDVFSRRVVGWQFAAHMRTDLVLDALRMALTRRRAGRRRRPRPSLRRRLAIHQLRVHAGPRRPRRARFDRVGRRRLRQRAGRELRRQLQDRAHPRPRVAHPQPARAGDRRVPRLVQHHPPARGARRPTPGRSRSPLRCPDRSDSLSQSMKRGNHQTRSPRNPARLRPPRCGVQGERPSVPAAFVCGTTS